jgi:micrococcal nuclease
MSMRAIGALAAFLWATGGGVVPMPANAEDARFGLCAELPYRTCVHNGDLIYLRGEPIRLSDVVSPDRYTAECPAASNIAWYAAIRLRDLLNKGPFDVVEPEASVDASGEGLMRRLERNGVSLGDALIDQGLARRRSNEAVDWCAEGP